MADFNEAIRIDPEYVRAYNGRGYVWESKREYDKAIADYTEAIRIEPKDADSYNNIAWLCATCPDARYRDGKRAVESATRACALADWKVADYLGTLAAACAEAGDFDAAVKYEGRAIELLPKDDVKLRKDFGSRRALYQAKTPYRDEPKGK